jgi:uncharacterized protein YutE (UPF0331/DUF86 family)
LAKAATIERCIRRFLEEYAAIESPTDFTHLDAMLLNVERACQAAIDLAMHVCAGRHLGIPQSASQSFDLLVGGGFLSADLGRRMKGMVGFRNVAIHAYTELDQRLTQWVAESGYQDLIKYVASFGVKISAQAGC